MRIALCTGGEIWGGIEAFMLAYARNLSSRSDVKVICVLLEERELAEELRKNSIAVRVVSEQYKYDISVIWRLKTLFKSEQIDIVHTNGYKANILCGLAAKWAGAKLVKTEHGTAEPGNWAASLKIWLNAWADQLLSRITHDAIVFVSRDLERIKGRSYRGWRREIIYNGIETDEYAGARHNAWTPGDMSRFPVCVAGRLSEVKGHRYLLSALKLLSDLEHLEVHILGTGPLERELKLYCATHGIANKVFFRGFLRPVEPHLKGMAVLVIPSLHEGLPYAMLEAMALGVPIVASAVGGIPEILRDEVNALLVAPCDEIALASAIRSLYNDRRLRSKLTENAHKKIRTDLAIESMADRYLHLYTRLA